MSFVVRRVGGGTFNPRAMCFSPDERFLFVACGSLIEIYALPNFNLVDHRTSHKADVTAIVCSESSVISGDRNGVILFHRYNEITIIDKTPSERYEHSRPIEKLMVRGGALYFVHFEKRMFCLNEYGNDHSKFKVTKELQKSLCDMHDSLVRSEPVMLRFPALDPFDIDASGRVVVVGDECKLHVFDFGTNKRKDYNLQQPARICRFRGLDVLVFTRNGFCMQFGEKGFSDHWHFVCPNDVVFDSSRIYSGGTEGVLMILHQNINRHMFLPRLGLTIEGLALSARSSFISAVVDKNILALIDCDNQSVRKSYSNLYGDVAFYGDIIASVRKPNLVQFFSAKSGRLIEQLQISTYNTRVAISAFALTEHYLVTVETKEGRPDPALTIAQQVDYNHVQPHGDRHVATDAYLNMLTRRKFDEKRKIMKMRYVAIQAEEEPERFEKKAIEGNPLVHDRQATESVAYSEVKIWTRNDTENTWEMEQSYRILGRSVEVIAVHPRFPLYCMVIGKELEVWKLSSKWVMWKTCKLGDSPAQLYWSPDGSILVVQYRNRLEFIAVEEMDVVATKQFEHEVLSISFVDDCVIVVHVKNGVALFDLRSLSVTEMMFVQPNYMHAAKGCVVFVVNRAQPKVVLYEDGAMKSWQLPTESDARAIHVLKDKGGIMITVIDDDNFIWSVEQYGSIETHEVSIPTISRGKPQEIVPSVPIALEEDKTQQIMDILEFPSHQIPKSEKLCETVFDIVLKKREEPEATTVHLECGEIEEEVEVPVVRITPHDLNQLKQMF